MTAKPPYDLDRAIDKMHEALVGGLSDINAELVLINNHLERIHLTLRTLGSKPDIS